MRVNTMAAQGWGNAGRSAKGENGGPAPSSGMTEDRVELGARSLSAGYAIAPAAIFKMMGSVNLLVPPA